eukprot:7154022-Prymnesium_polylepis.1
MSDARSRDNSPRVMVVPAEQDASRLSTQELIELKQRAALIELAADQELSSRTAAAAHLAVDIANGAAAKSESADAKADDAQASAVAASASAQDAAAAATIANDRHGVRPEIAPLVKAATVRIVLLNAATGKFIDAGSGTIVSAADRVPTNQIVTAAHNFIDPQKSLETFNVTVPPGKHPGDPFTVHLPGGDIATVYVPDGHGPGTIFKWEQPNPHFRRPTWTKPSHGSLPEAIDWTSNAAEVIIAIGVYQ